MQKLATIDPRVVRVFCLCCLVAAVDGFDTQIIGFTGRLIVADLHLPMDSLGWVFSAGQLGAICGAISFGVLADRYGRRGMLIIGCVMAAAFTAATRAADGIEQLIACRILTGIGLGGTLPCFLGLGVEASPPARRRTLAAILYASFPAGGAIGSLASSALIAFYGWRAVFLLAAVLLAAAALLAAAFLRSEPDRPIVRDAGRAGALVSSGLWRITVCLWFMFLLTAASLILLALWMPALLQMLGVSAARSGALVGCLNIGSFAVSIVAGWLMQRFGWRRFLVPVMLLGGISWMLISGARNDFVLLATTITVAGGLVGGAMTGLIVVASTVYPAESRASGVGWAIGVGRLGQVAAPSLVGLLIHAGWSPAAVLAICGTPLILSALVLLSLGTRLALPQA